METNAGSAGEFAAVELPFGVPLIGRSRAGSCSRGSRYPRPRASMSSPPAAHRAMAPTRWGRMSPSIVERVPLRSDDELIRLLHNGLPSSGMPPFPDIVDQERANLISYLRTLKPREGAAAARTTVKLEGGKTLQGTALNRSAVDMQLLGDDHKLYLLRQDWSRRVP